MESVFWEDGHYLHKNVCQENVNIFVWEFKPMTNAVVSLMSTASISHKVNMLRDFNINFYTTTGTLLHSCKEIGCTGAVLGPEPHCMLTGWAWSSLWCWKHSHSHIYSFYYVEILKRKRSAFNHSAKLLQSLCYIHLQPGDKACSLVPNYVWWRQKVLEMSALVLCCAWVVGALQQCSDSTTAKYRVLGRCT